MLAFDFHVSHSNWEIFYLAIKSLTRQFQNYNPTALPHMKFNLNIQQLKLKHLTKTTNNSTFPANHPNRPYTQNLFRIESFPSLAGNPDLPRNQP